MDNVDILVDNLKNNNCVLLLGPSLPSIKVNGKRLSVFDAFTNFLYDKVDEGGAPLPENLKSYYYVVDKYIKTKCGETRGHPQFKKILTEFQTTYLGKLHSIHRLLACLPFETVINIAPDDLLTRAFMDKGKIVNSAHYDFSGAGVKSLRIQNVKEEVLLEDDDLLVYNLFGTFNKRDSLVLSEEDQMRLIKSLSKNEPCLPTNLLSRMSDVKAKSFLFLGFDFDDWYFRLVFDSLNLPRSAKEPVSFAARQKEKDIAILNRAFYKDRFRFDFIDTDTEKFLGKLLSRYRKKYGPFKRKRTLFLYHHSDQVHFDKVKAQLDENGFRVRSEIFERSRIEVGGDKAAAKQVNEEFDMVIPFIGIEFMQDKSLSDYLTGLMKIPETKIVAIYTSPCPIQKLFPSPEDILPTNGTIEDAPGDSTYYTVARKLNNILR